MIPRFLKSKKAILYITFAGGVGGLVSLAAWESPILTGLFASLAILAGLLHREER